MQIFHIYTPKGVDIYTPKGVEYRQQRERKQGGKTMRTITVKTVKGYNIQKKENERGYYWVTLSEGKGWNKEVTFRSCKAAERYIETYL